MVPMACGLGSGSEVGCSSILVTASSRSLGTGHLGAGQDGAGPPPVALPPLKRLAADMTQPEPVRATASEAIEYIHW